MLSRLEMQQVGHRYKVLWQHRGANVLGTPQPPNRRQEVLSLMFSWNPLPSLPFLHGAYKTVNE